VPGLGQGHQESCALVVGTRRPPQDTWILKRDEEALFEAASPCERLGASPAKCQRRERWKDGGSKKAKNPGIEISRSRGSQHKAIVSPDLAEKCPPTARMITDPGQSQGGTKRTPKEISASSRREGGYQDPECSLLLRWVCRSVEGESTMWKIRITGISGVYQGDSSLSMGEGAG